MTATFRTDLTRLDRLLVALVRAQRRPRLEGVLHPLLMLRGTDISPAAVIGAGLRLPHGGFGIVVHGSTVIGDDVTIYPNVTIGRADIWRPKSDDFAGCRVGDGAILCAGAVVLPRHGALRIGRRTVVGANAVLTQSTGDDEIWAGAPARKIGVRDAAPIRIQT